MAYDNYTSIYLCLIFVLGYIFVRIESFTPNPRMAHSSVVVGNKLYFFGGIVVLPLPQGSLVNVYISEEVFYLDLSQPFDIENPPFVDLTSVAPIPIRSTWGTVALDSMNNNDPNIYLFGGAMLDINSYNDSYTSFVHKYNVNSLTWSVPSVSGTVPQRRYRIQAISDNAGKIYIFGGYADSKMGSPNIQLFNDMVIFNAAELSWLINLPTINAPTPSASIRTRVQPDKPG